MSTALITATTVTPSSAPLDAEVRAVAAHCVEQLALAGAALRGGRPADGPAIVAELAALATLTADPLDRAQAKASPEAADTEAFALGRDPEETHVYLGYFGIDHAAELTELESLAVAVPVLIVAVPDLLLAPIAPDYVADVLEMLGALILDLIGETGNRTVDSDTMVAAVMADTVDVVPLPPLARWVLGHQLYALANRLAARELERATILLGDRSSDQDGAVVALLRAERAVAAVTATLLYTAAITSEEYQTQVRHTMASPALPLELSGPMNLDHARYRRAVKLLIAAVKSSYAELVTACPRTAGAVERVLDRDLHDMTCHVELTFRLVRSAPALDEQAQGSAVQILRAAEIDRAQAYARHLRLGERIWRPICVEPSVHDEAGR